MRAVVPIERTFRRQLMRFDPQSPDDLQPFDFAVIRYLWTPQSGMDLDTRTAIIQPNLGNDLGWDRNGEEPNDGGLLIGCQVNTYGGSLDSYMMVHSGDNCQAGVEAILVNFPRLKQLYPAQVTFEIRMRAFWYRERGDGIVTLQFETYLGGEMFQDGYDFINIGGVEVDTVQVTRTTITNSVEADIDGEEMGSLLFTADTNTGNIVAP